MALYNKFDVFSEDLIRGAQDFDAHTYKICLSLTAPVATNTVLANISQIASGNGYTTDGITTTVTLNRSSGLTKVFCSDVVWTGGPAAMAQARYATWYNFSQTTPAKPLVGWWDYGSGVTVGIGETLTVDFDNVTTGALQLQ